MYMYARLIFRTKIGTHYSILLIIKKTKMNAEETLHIFCRLIRSLNLRNSEIVLSLKR